MKYTPTLSNNSLKTSIKVSAVLHVLCGLLLFFGLPRIIPPLPIPREPVSFEVVTIGEITNSRIKKEDELSKREPSMTPVQPKLEPPKPEPDKPEASKPEPPKPEPAKPEAPKPPEPAKPEPAKPEAVKEPEPEPMPAKNPKIPERNLDDILGDIKKKPVKEKPKPAKAPDPLGGVLKNLSKIEEKNAARAAQEAQDRPKLSLTDAMASAFGSALSDQLTISEEDALRRQFIYCWNPPIGAKDAHNLIVEIRIKVNPDRTVADAEIVDKGKYAIDPFFRAAADAALRAVNNPRCSPLALNPDSYEVWKDGILFNFDPRDML